MSKLIYQQSKADGILNAKLSGEIVDGTKMPEPDLDGVHTIELDLEDLRYLNSSGTRLWLLWSGKLAAGQPKILLHKVRPVFIRTLTSIREFLPKGSKLMSVFLPYFCEHCNFNHERLMINGKDFTRSPNRPDLEAHPCPKCGKHSELDAIVESYANAFEVYG